MKLSVLLIIFFFFSNSAFSQEKFSIRGSVSDINSGTGIENSRVLVLTAKDSLLIDFGITDKNGLFAIKQLPKGNYLLLVTYPNYTEYNEHFRLDSVADHNFGNIHITSKEILINEVIIKGRRAISVNGDTTEFNAEHLIIEPNSKVEDLLKQLPGMQIDKNGKITVHGQIINKVLVDGEEFFGDDPTLVTRNIRGDMVDKMQLYDKKSDQAVLTGIDDGKKIKTINVILKEDSKKGYFGKINGGVSPTNDYQSQLMGNLFKDKRKISAYGNFANTGQTGLGFENGNRYSTLSSTLTTINGISGFFDELEGTGQFEGKGIPVANTGGVHFDDKWNESKESININYKLGAIKNEGVEDIFSKQILASNIVQNTINSSFSNNTFRHKMDVVYQAQLDPSSSLKIQVDGTLRNVINNSLQTSLKEVSGFILTNQLNQLSSEGKQRNFNSNISWSKKFKKQRRSLYVTLNPSYYELLSKGYQNTENTFFNDQEVIDSTQFINQFKDVNLSGFGLKTTVAYSEPVNTAISLIGDYSMTINNGLILRETFNKAPSGFYNSKVYEFSNELSSKQFINKLGLILMFNKAKTILNFGTKVEQTNFNQRNLLNQTSYHRAFYNLLPQLSYQYKFSRQKTLKISFFGNTNQPLMDQLQPIKINDDPLNITIGNPNLSPSFTSRLTASFNSFKPLNNRSMNLSGNYIFTSNALIPSYFTDQAGKTVISSVNLTETNQNSYFLSMELGQKLKKPVLQMGFNLSLSGDKDYQLINNVLNTIAFENYGAGLEFSKYSQGKYNFSIGLNAVYNFSKQSIQNLSDDNWKINPTMQLNYSFLKKMEISLDASYSYLSNSRNFIFATNPFIIDISLRKKFFKDERLNIAIIVNNLLNNNPGFIRTANYQSNFTSVRRYTMLSVTWDFSKMPDKNQ